MQYLLFVFTARRDAMAMYDYCLRRRFDCAIVNTPREVSASCGVSLRVTGRYVALANQAERLRSFAGAYLVQEFQGRQSITRI